MPPSSITISAEERDAIFRNLGAEVYAYTDFDPRSQGPEEARRVMQALRLLEDLGWIADEQPDVYALSEPSQVVPVLHRLIEELETELSSAAKEIGTRPADVDSRWSEAEGSEYLEDVRRRADRDLDDRSAFLRVLAAIEKR
jgi:hypothetical protein